MEMSFLDLDIITCTGSVYLGFSSNTWIVSLKSNAFHFQAVDLLCHSLCTFELHSLVVIWLWGFYGPYCILSALCFSQFVSQREQMLCFLKWICFQDHSHSAQITDLTSSMCSVTLVLFFLITCHLHSFTILYFFCFMYML